VPLSGKKQPLPLGEKALDTNISKII